jgi:hypothetical protein
MAQHDYDIANADGATVRADLNSVLEAVATLNSGATAPSTTFANMWWADTANTILKRRNAANNAWISVMSLSTGLIIGTDVQAYNAALATIAGLSLVSGDILYATGAGALTRLAKGTDGQVLKLASGVPSWAAASAATAGTPLETTNLATAATTQAHGLGAKPSFLVTEIECLTAQHNWSIGDRVRISPDKQAPGGGTSWNIYDNATNVVALCNGTQTNIADKTTRANANITMTSWKLVVTPYLIT